MTNEKDPEENTKPIEVNPPIPNEAEPGAVHNKTVRPAAIPDWLLDFSSELNPPRRKAPAEPGAEIIEEVGIDEEQKADFSAPINLETSDWQPVQVEIKPIAHPADVEPADSSQVAKLLASGEYDQAVEVIRSLTLTEEEAQALRKQLRAYLTLRGEASPLWDVYNHLNPL